MAPVRCPGQDSALMSRALSLEARQEIFAKKCSKVDTPGTSRAYVWMIVMPVLMPLAFRAGVRLVSCEPDF